jgi:hypothetical protein
MVAELGDEARVDIKVAVSDKGEPSADSTASALANNDMAALFVLTPGEPAGIGRSRGVGARQERRGSSSAIDPICRNHALASWASPRIDVSRRSPCSGNAVGSMIQLVRPRSPGNWKRRTFRTYLRASRRRLTHARRRLCRAHHRPGTEVDRQRCRHRISVIPNIPPSVRQRDGRDAAFAGKLRAAPATRQVPPPVAP